MLIAPEMHTEASRLSALRRLRVLDSAPERSFDDVVALAAQICAMPIALVTLVDQDRQWFKAKLGLDLAQTGRRESFCGHAIGYPDRVMVVEDTWRDARFADNPLVTGDPGIRFYAGAPIVCGDGQPLGTVCVIDRQPRRLEAWQLASLRALAGQVGRMLEHRDLSAQDRASAWQGTGRAHRDIDRLLAIASSGRQLTAFVDPDFVVRFVNDGFVDYAGRARDRLVGAALAEVVGEPAFTQRLRPAIERGLAGETVDAEIELDFPARGSRHVLLHLEPAGGAGGPASGVILRAHDVQPFMDRMAALGERVERLERRTMVQQRMLHILAHDLSEPLNTVLSFSGLAQAEATTPKLTSYLSYVHGGAVSMKGLIDDLMRYVSTAQGVIAPRPVDLPAMVEQLRRDLADAIARQRGELRFEGRPQIDGEPVLVRLLLQNLVANALRFARPGVAPVVQVGAREAGTDWELTVTDNGIGIPAESREEVFDLFRRLAAARGLPGTGMGLALCRRIAEQHGGSIRVEPGPAGVGSCFRVVWPRLPATEPAQS
jgi:signal transduction histidine kinase